MLPIGVYSRIHDELILAAFQRMIKTLLHLVGSVEAMQVMCECWVGNSLLLILNHHSPDLRFDQHSLQLLIEDGPCSFVMSGRYQASIS